MRKTLIAIATVGVIASGAAFAGSTGAQLNHGFVPVQYSSNDRWDDRAASINDREARIKARIDRGVSDAELDHGGRIAPADGRLNHREEAQLKRDLDSLAQNVHVQLRDDDRSYSYNR